MEIGAHMPSFSIRIASLTVGQKFGKPGRNVTKLEDNIIGPTDESLPPQEAQIAAYFVALSLPRLLP
jgi:hypothetical protein